MANIAILAVLLSHGRTFASLKTMAKEVGCNIKTIRAGIKYWQKNGQKYGIEIKVEERPGFTSLIEIVIHRMEDTPTGNDLPPLPKTVGVPLPKMTYEEEPNQEDTPKKNRAIVVDKSSRPDRPESVGDILKRRQSSS